MDITQAELCNIPVRQRNGARNWQILSIRLPPSSVAPIHACRQKLSSIRGLVTYLLFEWREKRLKTKGWGGARTSSIILAPALFLCFGVRVSARFKQAGKKTLPKGKSPGTYERLS